jgi:hypothetical protein
VAEDTGAVDGADAPDPPQEVIYYGGDIITMDDSGARYAESVVQRGDEIVFVGSKSDATARVGDEAVEVDLDGRTMMPGFIEQHLHPFLAAARNPIRYGRGT